MYFLDIKIYIILQAILVGWFFFKCIDVTMKQLYEEDDVKRKVTK